MALRERLSAPQRQAPRRSFWASNPPRCRLGLLVIPRPFCSEPPPPRWRYPSTRLRCFARQRIGEHLNALPPAASAPAAFLLISILVVWASRKLTSGYRQKQEDDISRCISDAAATGLGEGGDSANAEEDDKTVPLYHAGMKVLYNHPGNGIQPAEVVEAHLDEYLVPYYTIRLVDGGKEKQTINDYIVS